MKCVKCNEDNAYAVANLPGNTFKCWKCRNESGNVAPTVSSDPAVPQTLDEAVEALLRTTSQSDLDWMKSNSEDTVLANTHFGVGMWIRNNWGLWHGGPLQDHFRGMGLWHADDMSGVILVSLYRHVNNLPRDLDSQVRHYLDYWAKVKPIP